jgi:hypothetical protein
MAGRIWNSDRIKMVNKNKRAMADPMILIVGALTIIGGILYIYNQSWGMLTVAIALLIEAVKQVIK